MSAPPPTTESAHASAPALLAPSVSHCCGVSPAPLGNLGSGTALVQGVAAITPAVGDRFPETPLQHDEVSGFVAN